MWQHKIVSMPQVLQKPLQKLWCPYVEWKPSFIKLNTPPSSKTEALYACFLCVEVRGSVLVCNGKL